MADQTKKSVPNQQKVNTIQASDQSNRFDKFGDSIDKREYRANQSPTSTTVWTIDMVRQALQDVARDAPINHPDKPPRSKSPFTCYALKNWKTIQEQFSRESPSEPSTLDLSRKIAQSWQVLSKKAQDEYILESLRHGNEIVKNFKAFEDRNNLKVTGDKDTELITAKKVSKDAAAMDKDNSMRSRKDKENKNMDYESREHVPHISDVAVPNKRRAGKARNNPSREDIYAKPKDTNMQDESSSENVRDGPKKDNVAEGKKRRFSVSSTTQRSNKKQPRQAKSGSKTSRDEEISNEIPRHITVIEGIDNNDDSLIVDDNSEMNVFESKRPDELRERSRPESKETLCQESPPQEYPADRGRYSAGFTVFAQNLHPQFMAEHPYLSAEEILKALETMWMHLSEREREPFARIEEEQNRRPGERTVPQNRPELAFAAQRSLYPYANRPHSGPYASAVSAVAHEYAHLQQQQQQHLVAAAQQKALLRGGAILIPSHAVAGLTAANLSAAGGQILYLGPSEDGGPPTALPLTLADVTALANQQALIDREIELERLEQLGRLRREYNR